MRGRWGRTVSDARSLAAVLSAPVAWRRSLRSSLDLLRFAVTIRRVVNQVQTLLPEGVDADVTQHGPLRREADAVAPIVGRFAFEWRLMCAEEPMSEPFERSPGARLGLDPFLRLLFRDREVHRGGKPDAAHFEDVRWLLVVVVGGADDA